MRHDLFSGARGAGNLFARVFGRKAVGGEAGKFPARIEARRRTFVLSPSLVDAGFLGVPYRFDGPGPADGDLPSALQPLSGKQRIEAGDGREGVGVLGRRRDG